MEGSKLKFKILTKFKEKSENNSEFSVYIIYVLLFICLKKSNLAGQYQFLSLLKMGHGATGSKNNAVRHNLVIPIYLLSPRFSFHTSFSIFSTDLEAT